MPLNARGFINLRRFIPLWMKTRRSIAIELGLDPCDPNLNLGDLLLPLSAAVDDRQSAGSKKPTSGHP